jgi:hypothetical protein
MFGYHGVNHLAREKGVQGDPSKNRFEVGFVWVTNAVH